MGKIIKNIFKKKMPESYEIVKNELHLRDNEIFSYQNIPDTYLINIENNEYAKNKIKEMIGDRFYNVKLNEVIVYWNGKKVQLG
jgi:hypothetical protein